MFDLSYGECISFRYPTSGSIVRRLEILDVRHLQQRPLAAITLAIYPDRRRGDALISGLDLDKFELRHFYKEQMSDVQRIPRPAMMLASYDPSRPDDPPKPLPASCLGTDPTVADLVTLMRRGNAHAINDPDVHRLLGLFTTDSVPQLRPNVRCA